MVGMAGGFGCYSSALSWAMVSWIQVLWSVGSGFHGLRFWVVGFVQIGSLLDPSGLVLVQMVEPGPSELVLV